MQKTFDILTQLCKKQSYIGHRIVTWMVKTSRKIVEELWFRCETKPLFSHCANQWLFAVLFVFKVII